MPADGNTVLRHPGENALRSRVWPMRWCWSRPPDARSRSRARQGLLRRAWGDQAGPGPLLPGCGGSPAARHGRPPRPAPAFPERRRGALVLSEEGARLGSRLAGDDHRQHPQRHHLARARGCGSRPRPVGGEPRLPRLPRVAREGGRPRARRRAAHRPRPHAGVTFPMVREAAHEVRALLDEMGVAAMPKTTGNRGIHVYVRLQPRWTSYEVRSATVGRRPRAGAPAVPSSSPRRGGRRSGAVASSSTSTRTRRTRPSSAHGRCAPDAAPRYRPRSAGTSSTASTRMC